MLFESQLFFKDGVIDWIISQKEISNTQCNGAWEEAAGYTEELLEMSAEDRLNICGSMRTLSSPGNHISLHSHCYMLQGY